MIINLRKRDWANQNGAIMQGLRLSNMPPKEDSKKIKPKIHQQDELQRFLGSPDKKEEDYHKNVNLRDLSPYSPILRTIKKSYDNANVPYDFAMIETPNVQKMRRSFLQQMDNHIQVPEISKLLNWDCEDQEQSNEYSSQTQQISQEEEALSENNEIKEDMAADHMKNESGPIQRAKQAVIKAGESLSDDRKLKDLKQKSHRRKPDPPIQNKKLTCNCKKTQCLKLYCDCFRENQVCGESCNCTGCHNTEENQAERNNAMLTLMERNPEAFKPKLEAEQHAKGCNCKKSACLKKYCECFQAGLSCGEHCKCEDCKNGGCEDQNPHKAV